MKQKTSRGLCRRIQKNGSERKHIFQSTPSANDFKKNKREADGGVPLIRFKLSNGGDEARRRPRAAVVAGGDPRQGREIGVYLRDQGGIPCLWEVVVVAGEYHVDDELCSGGRRLGWSRDSSKRAAEIKLRRGLGSW